MPLAHLASRSMKNLALQYKYYKETVACERTEHYQYRDRCFGDYKHGALSFCYILYFNYYSVLSCSLQAMARLYNAIATYDTKGIGLMTKNVARRQVHESASWPRDL